jgi:NADH-quinone oxidoreductase subunit F
MPALKNFEDLTRLHSSVQAELGQHRQSSTTILIGMGTCGLAAGASEVAAAIREQLVSLGLEAQVVGVGCIGMCVKEPLVDIQLPGRPRVTYANVRPEMVPRLIEEHLGNQRVVKEWVLAQMIDGSVQPEVEIPTYAELPFYRKQIRVALSNCGMIDPENIEDYLEVNGYQGLARALSSMTPDEVIEEVKDSGLRGRGGAGFLTGVKWEFCRKARGNPKYVICNADEGDPGAFMDRSILEGDPYAVLEGMTIAGYAIGAQEGYIYCRAEYPLAIVRLKHAISQAHDYALLGKNILGTDFSFDLKVKEGAGAFVCGEETALIASIEGKRGEPRPRPPFPAVSGLWGKPSNVNNVKSYAITPRILLNGADWFNSIGTPKSPGTAVFALTGKINNTGLIEVPMGIPLGEIIFDIGNGIPNNKPFKAVQTGGPLGGCLPASALNTRVDFDSLVEAGATMGSGGMIVVDDDTCMVEFAKYFLTFASAESCGKCVPCRLGGKRLLEILTRITEGEGTCEDLGLIEEISRNMKEASLCALGQLTPGPVMASLRFFREEFIAHIEDQYCPAGQCKPLVRAKCINACPAGVDSPAYLALVAQRRYSEGLAIHRQRNPFALICGRVCPAFCEAKCRRGEIDTPIAIRMVKRFMADQEFTNPWTPELVVSIEEQQAVGGKKIAIIGSGPAGLTAALRLAQRGYQPVIFEKLPIPGGMMTVGIPEYRLPRGPLFAEIENIQRAGVEIRCNQALGRDFTLDQLLDRDGYHAVVLAIGAHKSRRLGIPGEEMRGVIHGTDFLRDIALSQTADQQMKDISGEPAANLGELTTMIRGKRVAVVGGGDVAIDAARSAWRLGASQVHVIYRRQRQDMPAHPEEIEAAMEEGIQFYFLANPSSVLGNESVTGVVVQRQRLAEFDNSGRRRPIVAEEEFTLDIEVLIPAIGQTTELPWKVEADGKVLDGVEISRSDTLIVKEAFNTTRAGVFAIGDAVSGPATVVQAVAQGNLVAVAIDNWIRTGKIIKPRFETPRTDIPQRYNLDDYANAQRPEIPEINPAERARNFHEVETGFDTNIARQEAKRCLRCDLEWLERSQ